MAHPPYPVPVYLHATAPDLHERPPGCPPRGDEENFVTTTMRGGCHLYYRGYVYQRLRQFRLGKVQWRCLRQKICRAKAWSSPHHVDSNGVPILEMVKPPHTHPPCDNPRMEQEYSEARVRIRELCLQNPSLQPSEVLQQVVVTASSKVREYLLHNKLVIKRNIRNLRQRKVDPLSSEKRSCVHMSKQKLKEKIKQIGDALSNPCTSTTTPDFQIMDCTPVSPSDANHKDMFLKKEGAEELILEDYEYPNYYMETHFSEMDEKDHDIKDNNRETQPLPNGEPFETVICGSEGVEVKHEHLEEESESFNSTMEAESTCLWSTKEANLISSDPGLSNSKDSTNELTPTASSLQDKVKRGQTNPLSTDASEKNMLGLDSVVQDRSRTTEKPQLDTSTSPSPLSEYNTTNVHPTLLPSSTDHHGELYISLQSIAAEHRQAAKHKILELVQFFSIGNVNPSKVSFMLVS